VKRQQTITYWEFSIDIIGPRFRTRAQRRAIHKILSRKRLREIEHAAQQATRAMMPSGFRAILS
jgi:ribosomal protein L32E